VFTVAIDEITEGGLNVDWQEDPSSLAFYLENFPRIDFCFEAPLTASARIWKAGQSVMIKGSVAAVLGLRCVRCLEGFSQPISSTFEVTLLPMKETSSEEEVELGEDDMESNFYEGGELHLSEIACEQIFLEIPYQPLCREDCKGLCSVCGKDLNRTSCECRREDLGTGFAVLRTLKLDN
jgi:uncharacterized protein